MFSSGTDEWATPTATFAALDAKFHFDLDPCATDINHKCPDYYTKKENGLLQDWGGRRVFCNPPYGRAIAAWVKKCLAEIYITAVDSISMMPRTQRPFHL